jgi:hypothetical protein
MVRTVSLVPFLAVFWKASNVDRGFDRAAINCCRFDPQCDNCGLRLSTAMLPHDVHQLSVADKLLGGGSLRQRPIGLKVFSRLNPTTDLTV